MKRARPRKSNKTRLLFVFLVFVLCFIALTFRLGWHMIIKGDEYASKATGQQTSDTTILATRGSIVDRNGADLAISATTHTIWVRPDEVRDNGKTDEEKALNIQLEAKTLADTLGMDFDNVMEIITSERKLLKVAKNVDRDTADALRAQKLAGLEITEDAKRYYPLGAFASQVIGSTTDDNNGLAGIELRYNRYLAGLNGRWIKNKDNARNTLAYGKDSYFSPEDGYTAVLTIDQNIQYIVQQEIAACQEKTKSARVMCLIMDPKNGEILASAQTGEYDPNNPRDPLPQDAEAFAEMTTEEQVDYWNKMWRNFNICDTYEPGSTFKLLTSSIALDTGVTNLTEQFYCGASIQVYDWQLKCWNYPHAHGWQDLAEAVMNSCNVTMVQLVQRIGATRFWAGLDAFGITERTGVDYPGEGGNILQNENGGPVELATMSYGQGIAVTPVSLVSAVASLANDGYVMQPHFVKALLDSNGDPVMTFEPQVRSQSISEQTAHDMLDIMEYYIVNGSGGRMKIPGYNTGGKTGTANKPVKGGYSATDVYGSFIGIAPIEDPKFVILVICDSPRGTIYGSTTAGPCAVEIEKRVLQYMGVTPEYTEKELKALNRTRVTIPNVVGMDGEAAMGKLSSLGLESTLAPMIETTAKLNIIDQFPKAGEEVEKGFLVTLYYEIEEPGELLEPIEEETEGED
ncbi:MAG: PASTA domain-containing protein [Firmicutes bacterium]|nr:PASTA domain-containing protein [Bacillota bacterium]